MSGLSSGVSRSASTSLAARAAARRARCRIWSLCLSSSIPTYVFTYRSNIASLTSRLYTLFPSHKCCTLSISLAPARRSVRYASALSALAALMELARAYLHRKHESLPRKLCAPHFWQLQSPCFHLELEAAPPPAAFSVAFAFLASPSLSFLLLLEDLSIFLSFFLRFFFTPPSTAVALSLGLVGFGRSRFGLRGLRFAGLSAAAVRSDALLSSACPVGEGGEYQRRREGKTCSRD